VDNLNKLRTVMILVVGVDPSQLTGVAAMVKTFGKKGL
jgi:hypothetical protein